MAAVRIDRKQLADPLELGLRLAIIDDVDLDIIGALGVRFYF